MSEQDDVVSATNTDFAKVVKRLAEAEARIERMDSLVHKLSADMDFCSADNEILGQQIGRLEAEILSHKESIEMLIDVSLRDGNRINALEQRNGETR